MQKLLTILLCLLSLYSFGQYASHITYPDTTQAVIADLNDISVVLANSITNEDMQKHLYVLASDEYEGRETGETGNSMAASYIAKHFQNLNLPKIGEQETYYQGVAFNKTQWNKNVISVNGKEYKHLWDYLAFASMNESLPYIESDEIVFLGYGIDDPLYSDYKGNKLKDKIILINSGEPIDKNGKSYLTGSSEFSDWSKSLEKKLSAAKKHGVKFVFIIENEIQKFLSTNRKLMVGGSLTLGDGTIDERFANHAFISSTIGTAMIGKKARKVKRWRKKNIKKAKTKDIKLKSKLVLTMDKKVEVIAGNNVLGYIEGTDKKDELIVISAHYDHLGMRGKDIYNGADDNGSGTTTVLEIAEAFSLAKNMGAGPRRSVLCLLVTGEEKGLLGSEYYAANPIFPLEKTVANVNIDMVGRVDKKNEANPNYIYVIGSDRLSTDLHKINEETNQKYSQILLDYEYNAEDDPNRYYYRSDHYNFAKNGIPAIFYFNGVHADYHRTTDTVEKINFAKMEKVGRHFFHTAWELANREERIIVDGKVED